jgi:hypothetical protein
MAHFAEINENNIVIRVLVVDNSLESEGADFLANQLGLGGTWIQTSYNSSIRKNYAGVGYIYDSIRDAFIAPEPINNLGFDEETCTWIMPDDPEQLHD